MFQSHSIVAEASEETEPGLVFPEREFNTWAAPSNRAARLWRVWGLQQIRRSTRPGPAKQRSRLLSFDTRAAICTISRSLDCPKLSPSAASGQFRRRF